MNLWHTVLLVVHIIAALGIIVLVLLQQGKGADMGAAFGGGSSGSLFGAAISPDRFSTGFRHTVATPRKCPGRVAPQATRSPVR